MKTHKVTEQDYLKAYRKASREEEIARHWTTGATTTVSASIRENLQP